MIAGKQPLDFDNKLGDGIRAGDRFVEHFDYLADTYFQAKSHVTFNGKAVVQVISFEKCSCRTLLSRVMNECGKAGSNFT